MADSGIPNFMSYLGRRPAAAEVFAASQTAARSSTERHVVKIERDLNNWMLEGHRLFAATRESVLSAKHDKDVIAEIDEMVLIMEGILHGLSLEFKNKQKACLKIAKILKSNKSSEIDTFTSERDRIFRAEAAANSFFAEIVLAFRAMRAELDPAHNSGPSFDNPDALAKYLNDAVA